MLRANYGIVYQDARVVAIVDNNTGRSVTNDAENVIRDLDDRINLGARRVVYQDTSGRWDELVHKNGIFERFASIGVDNMYDAVSFASA